MYLIYNNRHIINNGKLYNLVQRFFTHLIILPSLLFFGCLSMLHAEIPDPACFPMESAWENIEFETVNYNNNQNPMIRRKEHTITLTFNKFENYLPQFYGFAFLKKDLPNIPKITKQSALAGQFGGIELIALKKNTATDNVSYRFTSPKEGTWVIYLIAAMNKIPFLEQKQLRIFPTVENIRGGSIFSGSSLNLVDPIDYKACEILMEH